jgi:hypothetical protein
VWGSDIILGWLQQSENAVGTPRARRAISQQYQTFCKIGHIFLPKGSLDDRGQSQSNYVDEGMGGISFSLYYA